MHRGLAALVAAMLAAGAIPSAGAHPGIDASSQPVPSERLTDIGCRSGHAGPFPCRNVDLLAYLPPSEIGGGRMAAVWGWDDPKTGREYALVGKSNGTAIVDVTRATQPLYLGDLRKSDSLLIWVDVEVYKNHAFIVSESLGGMWVFDLTRLRGVKEPQRWTPDFVYPLAPSAHTLRINTDSGFAYINGSLAWGGGPHIVDIRDPEFPSFAGYIGDDGYTHDSHCVNYRGPDKRFRKREVCLNANEDTLTIYDVTDKRQPQRLSRTGYDSARYTHSGWLTRDHAYFLMSDEGDELDLGLPTTTYVWDVRDLRAPELIGTYHAKTKSIDHNVYIEGQVAYQASYTAGLRLLDASRADAGKLREVGYFDVMPDTNDAQFDGSWGAYPFLDSGNVLVTGMGQGFFVVRPRIGS